MIDYANTNELHIKSQAEFDAIPNDYHGRIFIEFGTRYNRAVINRHFYYSVEAWENSSVVARENSSVVAWENSSVVARENSSVEAWGNSSVEAWENSSVVARENSSVVAWGNSSVEAWGNSSVEAWGNSSVEAWENSSVVAWGNSQIVDRSYTHKIQVSGNARIVYNPKTITEYMDYYGLDFTKTTGRFYKAVHRAPSGNYVSDYDPRFHYEIGAIVKSECSNNTQIECSYGIHMSYLAWAISFGANWNDLAILELESDLDKVVLPVGGEKVRTSVAKVIREVPIEEWGVYGKMIAERNGLIKEAT